MPCTKIKDGFACSFIDKWTYICFEHTTYILEFSKFGPVFYRLESGKEIEIDIDFDDDNRPTSNKFLWDIFEEWHYK
jgi:hypothetical protein